MFNKKNYFVSLAENTPIGTPLPNIEINVRDPDVVNIHAHTIHFHVTVNSLTNSLEIVFNPMNCELCMCFAYRIYLCTYLIFIFYKGQNSVFALRLEDVSGVFDVEPKLVTGSSPVSIRIANGTLDYENPNQRKFIVLVRCLSSLSFSVVDFNLSVFRSLA